MDYLLRIEPAGTRYFDGLLQQVYARPVGRLVQDPRVPSYALNCSVMINTALQRSVTLVPASVTDRFTTAFALGTQGGVCDC